MIRWKHLCMITKNDMKRICWVTIHQIIPPQIIYPSPDFWDWMTWCDDLFDWGNAMFQRTPTRLRVEIVDLVFEYVGVRYVWLNILHVLCHTTNVTPRPSTFVGLRPSTPIKFDRRCRMLCPPDFPFCGRGIFWNMDNHGFYHLLYIYRISSCTAHATKNLSQK